MLIRLSKLKNDIKKFLNFNEYPFISRCLIELKDINELCKIFGWEKKPLLDSQNVYRFRNLTDVNDRRRRDAETIATIIRNTEPGIILEIGTGRGITTALMSMNSPDSRIFTVNAPAGEISAGKAGRAVTEALDKDVIGSYYRSRQLKNITQIYANTAGWRPEMGLIDFAFIDGCHDTDFVYNDTLKILKSARKGTFVVWHDFNPEYTQKYDWIHSVCKGVEKLFSSGRIKGNIFHVEDSWTGIYRIEQ